YARRDDDRVASREGDDRKPYARRDDDRGASREGDDRKPYARRDDDRRPSREGDNRKPYARRDDDRRPSREEVDRKPYARRDDDRNPSSFSNDRKSYSDRTPGKSFGKKPFEKKREKYSDRDHSKEMNGRFDKRKDEKKFKTRNDRTAYRDKAPSMPSEPGEVRLNRFIANAGICSRREADELIVAGVISVNGEIVTELGTKVMPGDSVKYHDQTLKTEKLVYVLLNKPKDYITTTDDPEERRTVMALVHDAGKERIVPVGRLDRNTTGLLLLTNDGELTKRLTHPSGNIKKLYQVELDKNLTQADMLKAAEGIELEDGIVNFDEIQYASPDDKSIVGVELHSGKNRIVRRIFEAMGYEVRKLDRTTFAGLTKKDLPRGRWRYLTDMEINMLKMLTGKKN
ncbi:MAG TPA: pseudouridine synthase, partial [Bacteroidia bacterium]|nr:pseudouridine synthase [Bacteroidia bacterium]